ncbi:hypothetical protein PIROE2DRAFT_6901 [Piromyces sp. E2]|nr:hypothetical protein PIROE2DRAFT_6901 [Piromyces sp. E2]|eukprot:OUM66006.1 hypothetical protein PIROE2DRAFT_6901 [Piromyces sp. E2]
MNECPTGCGHNCLPSLGHMNMASVNGPYNRIYYREPEPVNKHRLSNAKNPNLNRIPVNSLPESYQQSRTINPVMNQNQIMMKSNYIPNNPYNQTYEVINTPYVNPKISSRPYEGYENHSYMKQPFSIPHPNQGSISPVNRRYNSVIIDMDNSQLMNSYVSYVPHSLPDNTQFFNEPNLVYNKHSSYHGMNHSINHSLNHSLNSYKNSIPMVSERKIIHPVVMTDPSIPYSPLIEYSAINNTKGPSIIAANGIYDESIPNIYENNSILGKAKSEIYHPVLNPNSNFVKNNTVHGFVTNPLNNNDTSSYMENDSILENENPNEISNDSSFNNGIVGGIVSSSSNYPELNNTSNNNNNTNSNIKNNNNTNNNNLTVEPENNRINLLSPSKTSIIKTLINSPSAAFSKLSGNAGGFKSKSNKSLSSNNLCDQKTN